MYIFIILFSLSQDTTFHNICRINKPTLIIKTIMEKEYPNINWPNLKRSTFLKVDSFAEKAERKSALVDVKRRHPDFR